MAMTKAELKRVHELRQAEMEESSRRHDQWNAAPVGFTESETVYVIEYQYDNKPTWYACHPFYVPLTHRPEETHDEAMANEVADLLLQHKRGITQQSTPGDTNVTGVRVVKRISSARIISETHG